MTTPLANILQELETVLGTDLGVQSNGAPAIFAEINGNKANTSGVVGLACIVQASTQSNFVVPSSRGEKFVDEFWDVLLVQFDRSKTCQSAKRKIQKYFPIMRGGISETPGTEKMFEMCRVKIHVRGFI